MKICGKHIDAVNLLITNRFNGMKLVDIAKKVGVTLRTIVRWRADRDFKVLYNQKLDEHFRNISAQPMAMRVDRLRELWKL